MFINSKNIITSANRLSLKSLSFKNENIKKFTDLKNVRQLHTTENRTNYAAAAEIPLPINIDAAENTRFSPQRARDISGDVIISHYNQSSSPMSTIDITADNSYATQSAGADATTSYDPHVESYDCFGAVSLNSVMQSNVPTPFGGMHKFSHLNMPGGQWSQEYKFTSQNLQSSHYRALRDNARASWADYDANAVVGTKQGLLQTQNWQTTQISRNYSTTKQSASTETTVNAVAAADATTSKEEPKAPLSKKEKLKQLVKDYGSTVIVFHVGISLVSLGGCYLMVSSGINMMPVLEYLGLASSTLSTKIATGSTFVVAYAIHKVFAPVRISITLGATPFIVRYLRSKGLLKVKAATTAVK